VKSSRSEVEDLKRTSIGESKRTWLNLKTGRRAGPRGIDGRRGSWRVGCLEKPRLWGTGRKGVSAREYSVV
jgi:hypothetical protein